MLYKYICPRIRLKSQSPFKLFCTNKFYLRIPSVFPLIPVLGRPPISLYPYKINTILKVYISQEQGDSFF